MRLPANRVSVHFPPRGTLLGGISLSLRWEGAGGDVALTSCWAQSREAGQRGDPLIWMRWQEKRQNFKQKRDLGPLPRRL